MSASAIFRERLRELMAERDISVAALAKLSGVPDPTLRSVLKREKSKIQLDVAADIATSLEVPLPDMIDEPGAQFSPELLIEILELLFPALDVPISQVRPLGEAVALAYEEAQRQGLDRSGDRSQALAYLTAMSARQLRRAERS